ncbi:MAG: hypothetical protein QMD03_02825 [Syntrophales bacterium]|nr:hypothetical protein [Syntrophales bacterium]
MPDFIKKAMLAGAGLAFMTTEKIQEFVDELVKKGEVTEKEARETVADLREKSKQFKKEMEERTEKIVTGILRHLNVPTKVELEEIKERLERLEKSGEHKE